MPANYANQVETLWQVQRAFSMEGGIAAPWMDAEGMGIQWKFPKSVSTLKEAGDIAPYLPK